MANRTRRTSIGVSLLALMATTSGGVDRNISLTYDEAWKRTLQILALEGVTVTGNDKEAGIIQGNGTFQKESKNFTCQKIRGRVESYTFNISAAIRQTPAGAVVSIRAEGSARSFEYRRFIFFRTSRVYYDTPCDSTGNLEESLLSKLAGP